MEAMGLVSGITGAMSSTVVPWVNFRKNDDDDDDDDGDGDDDNDR